jgi:hypothetical protein
MYFFILPLSHPSHIGFDALLPGEHNEHRTFEGYGLHGHPTEFDYLDWERVIGVGLG